MLKDWEQKFPGRIVATPACAWIPLHRSSPIASCSILRGLESLRVPAAIMDEVMAKSAQFLSEEFVPKTPQRTAARCGSRRRYPWETLGGSRIAQFGILRFEIDDRGYRPRAGDERLDGGSSRRAASASGRIVGCRRNGFPGRHSGNRDSVYLAHRRLRGSSDRYARGRGRQPQLADAHLAARSGSRPRSAYRLRRRRGWRKDLVRRCCPFRTWTGRTSRGSRRFVQHLGRGMRRRIPRRISRRHLRFGSSRSRRGAASTWDGRDCGKPSSSM